MTCQHLLRGYLHTSSIFDCLFNKVSPDDMSVFAYANSKYSSCEASMWIYHVGCLLGALYINCGWLGRFFFPALS